MILMWNYKTETYDEVPETYDEIPKAMTQESCECQGQGLCRDCRVWMWDQGYEEWSG
jgi:hypothetical protein